MGIVDISVFANDWGIVGLLAWLVSEKVVNKFKKDDQERYIKDLWDWHNHEDDDGVKIWYVRRSLENAIIKLSENIEKQTDILTELLIIRRTKIKN